MLKRGTRAPDFQAVDQHGNPVTLDSLLARGRLVLYFYPKDFTRVCTQQACLMRDSYESLQGAGVEVTGVSVDTSESHSRFTQEHQLPFPLLADPEKHLARLYDVVQILGFFTKRVTYVIDQEKMIRGVFHHELSAAKHLADIQSLLSELRTA